MTSPLADPAWILLVVVRFVHYGAVTGLFGTALFPLYAGTNSPLPRRWVLGASWVALLTTVAWFLATVAEMSGDLSAAFALDLLWPVLRDMAFGHLAAARLVLAGLTVWAMTTRAPPMVLAHLSGLLLASLAGVGHARLQDGTAGLADVAADSLHLLAAGAWIGGLAPLSLLAVTHDRGSAGERAFGQTLHRFSLMGYAAVGTLVATGLFNGWRLVGSVSNLTTTPYGQILVLKVGLFLAMLALAAINRLWISPPLWAPALNSDTAPWLNRLKHHIIAEQGLAVVILAVVSWLGVIEPPA